MAYIGAANCRNESENQGMSKVLSIIIAAYNVEAYLDNTLHSCVMGDCRLQGDYEVIVVNDGSRDGTLAIANQYAQQWPEVFRVIDKHNGGYGSVINVGIEAAEGKYFKLLDGDDWYDVQALAELIWRLRSCDSDMVLTNYVMVHEGSGRREVFKYAELEQEKLLPPSELWKLSRPLAMHGICYKTDILRKMPVSITEHCFYTDTEYVIYGLAYVKSVTYYPLDLYQYRIGLAGQSVSPTGLERHIGDLERVIAGIETFHDQLQDGNNKDLVSYRIAMSYRGYYTSLLLLPGSREVRQKIKIFDERIKAQQPERYRWMENKKFRILRGVLRATGYWAYGLCAHYYRWEKKRDER